MKRIWLFLFPLFANFVSAQNNNSKFLQSPNAASLGIYGSIDVSPFTGLPNINVNIFSLTEKDIPIAAGLRYFAGGVKPEAHPGWVGQNWTLDVGGVITRKINGGVDEVAESTLPDDQTYSYYYHKDVLSASNWNTNSFVQNYWPNVNPNSPNQDPNRAIPAPDEFMFTLPNGISGSFFYNHEGKWVVKSSQAAYLVVTVELNPQPVRLEHLQYLTYPSGFIDIKRLFYKMTITDNDGVKYTFGNNKNAIEFTRGPRTQVLANNEDVIANAWYLTKIESPKGDIVDFEYQRKENQYVQGVSYSHIVNSQTTANSGLNCNGTNLNPRQYSTQMISPVYLKEIRSSSFRVEFEILSTTDFELKQDLDITSWEHYPYNDLLYIHASGQVFYDNPPTWYKLNSIKVFDYNDNLREKHLFTYNNNPNERLFLKKVSTVSNANNGESKDYSFDYYDDTPLPGYNSLMVDEWGYFNGKAYPTNTTGLTASQVLYYLSPDASSDVHLMRAGTLKKITYPTKGYTQFYFETNDYSKALEKIGNSIQLNSKTGDGGGLRISKVVDYENGVLKGEKEYIYSKAETPTISSGILAGNKKVHYNYQIGNPLLGYGEYITNSSLSDLNYTNGRDVVYSEVKEKYKDGSYTIYKYSNSDNLDYRDEVPLNIYSDAYKEKFNISNSAWTSSLTYPILSHISRQQERGLLLSKATYNTAGTIVYKVENQYRDDAARFNEFVRSYDNYGVVITCPSDGIIMERYFQAIKIYTYFSYLKKQTESLVDPQSGQFIVTTKNFIYDNTYGLLKEQNSLTSKGYTSRQSFKYCYDYPINVPVPAAQRVVYRTMAEKNMLSTPIETVNSITIGGVEKVYGASLTLLSKDPTTGIIAASKQLQLEIDQPVTDFTGSSIPLQSTSESFQYDSRYIEKALFKYDEKGNLIEHQKPGDVITSYLWGYKKMYPVAQVSGSDYTTISSLVNQSVLDNPTSTETQVKAEHTALRAGLSGTKALVTAFTFKPLVGITTQTDPNGKTIYYEYEGLNRLYLIRDQNNNILKRFCYNYSGQGESCPNGITENTSPLWQPTFNLRCVLDGNGNNTGEQEHEEMDNNPYSLSHTVKRWVNDGPNLTACPTTYTCSGLDCNGEGYQCINNQCELGYKVYTASWWDWSAGQYYCVYHYEFSDGSWSLELDYFEYSNTPCYYD